MPTLCLYFRIHHSRLLKHYTVFDIDRVHDYENKDANRRTIEEIADRCYLPVNRTLLDTIEKLSGRFRFALSISGIVLDDLEKYRFDVIESFKQLAETGAVEFIGETYYHSFAFLFSRREFRKQVIQHREKIDTLFRQVPRCFSNTELVYNNDVARTVGRMGYRIVLAEGAERTLGWRSPDFAYRPVQHDGMTLLLRNHRLSRDLGACFARAQEGHPVTAAEFVRSIHLINVPEAVINLVLDYDALGHRLPDREVHDLLMDIPVEILANSEFRFQTPAEVAASSVPIAPLDVPDITADGDGRGNIGAWTGNALQNDALNSLYGMESDILRSGDDELISSWRMLQMSDHFHLMNTMAFSGGAMLKSDQPFSSPYEAYINFMNIIDDLSSSAKNAIRSARRTAARRVKGPS